MYSQHPSLRVLKNKMQVTIYHNPSCSKSRQALKILHEQNILVTIVDYLSEPPTKTKLKSLLYLLNCPAQALLRTKESLYAELKLDDSSIHSEETLIDIMHRYPQLIERPIVVIDDTIAFIARPPEKILEYLR